MSNHGGIMFIMSNQNIITQGMSNQDLKKINNFFATYSPEQPHKNYHNYKMTNQDTPKDEQPFLLLIFLSNQFGTYIYCEQPEHCLSADDQPLCLFFFVSNQLFFCQVL